MYNRKYPNGPEWYKLIHFFLIVQNCLKLYKGSKIVPNGQIGPIMSIGVCSASLFSSTLYTQLQYTRYSTTSSKTKKILL